MPLQFHLPSTETVKQAVLTYMSAKVSIMLCFPTIERALSHVPIINAVVRTVEVVLDLAFFLYCYLFIPHPLFGFFIYGIARYRTDLPAGFLFHTRTQMVITADPPLALGSAVGLYNQIPLGLEAGAEGMNMLPTIATYIENVAVSRTRAMLHFDLLPRHLRIVPLTLTHGGTGAIARRSQTVVRDVVENNKKRKAIVEAQAEAEVEGLGDGCHARYAEVSEGDG